MTNPSHSPNLINLINPESIADQYAVFFTPLGSSSASSSRTRRPMYFLYYDREIDTAVQ